MPQPGLSYNSKWLANKGDSNNKKMVDSLARCGSCGFLLLNVMASRLRRFKKWPSLQSWNIFKLECFADDRWGSQRQGLKGGDGSPTITGRCQFSPEARVMSGTTVPECEKEERPPKPQSFGNSRRLISNVRSGLLSKQQGVAGASPIWIAFNDERWETFLKNKVVCSCTVKETLLSISICAAGLLEGHRYLPCRHICTVGRYRCCGSGSIGGWPTSLSRQPLERLFEECNSIGTYHLGGQVSRMLNQPPRLAKQQGSCHLEGPKMHKVLTICYDCFGVRGGLG